MMLNSTDRKILHGIMDAELEALQLARRLRKVHAEGFTGYRRVQHFRALAEAGAAPRQGVRVNLERWLKVGLTSAVCRAGHRALVKLAAAGLIERTAPLGGKLTHAILTAAGRGIVCDELKAQFSPEELALPPKAARAARAARDAEAGLGKEDC
jgi:hypothetical protein